jgi:hypothetical protein
MKIRGARLAGISFFFFIRLATLGDDWLDRARDALSFSTPDGKVRGRLSGLLDLEVYRIEQPPPGLISTDLRTLVNPRVTLFFDGQLGSKFYVFAEARLDRGFDPTRDDAEMRLDEYAVRFTPWEDGRFALQIGKFGTVVGNWIQRYNSWDNPFISAPLPYENLTSVWDSSAPDSATTLRGWSHILPEQLNEPANAVYADKYLRQPVLWGPSYASGVAVSGRIGKFEAAAELKNTSLSSRPETWDITATNFAHPTFSTRIGLRPNAAWNFGISASTGAYFLPQARGTLPPGKDIGDYRELVLGQDIRFEWHHLQIWAEFYEARFEVPGIGNADTFAYYLEAKYKLTTQFFGAVRWNQQLFATVRDDPPNGGRVPWAEDVWRIDAAVGYRFSAHTQLKLQYSLDYRDVMRFGYGHTLAGQFTLKF